MFDSTSGQAKPGEIAENRQSRVASTTNPPSPSLIRAAASFVKI